MAQRLAGRRLVEEEEKALIILDPPQRLAGFRQRVHHPMPLLASDGGCNIGIAGELDHAAKFDHFQRPPAETRQHDRGSVPPGGGQGEELRMRRAPDMRDRIGEVPGDEAQ